MIPKQISLSCPSLIIFRKHHSLNSRAQSLVVSDLRLETEGSRFESGCYLFAEMSCLQQLPSWCLSVCEAVRIGSEGLKECRPLPQQSCISWMVVEENPDRKKNLKAPQEILIFFFFCLICEIFVALSLEFESLPGNRT